MSNIWCRLHVETLHDVKVQKLPPDLFKAWISMLLIAKLHDGVLPDLGTVAYHLHLTEQKAGALVGKLAAAELLDAVPGGYYEPHNWHERQYVNKNDPTAAERNKRHRNKKKNEKRNGYGNVTAVTVTAPEQSRADTEVEDDQVARARPPLISAEANKLADECAKIAGHDLAFIPPSWCGAAYRTQVWLNQGWPADLILESVRSQTAKKRDGPAKTITYFEPGIASAIAKANQPLPNIVQIPGKTVEVANGPTSNKSGLAAIDRIFDRPEMRSTFNQTADEAAVLSLPAGSVQRP